jgi:hypothetical protein
MDRLPLARDDQPRRLSYGPHPKLTPTMQA